MNGVSRATFEELSADNQRIILYEMLVDIKGNNNDRLCAIEATCKSRMWCNWVTSGAGGIIGGFLAMLTKLKFWE